MQFLVSQMEVQVVQYPFLVTSPRAIEVQESFLYHILGMVLSKFDVVSFCFSLPIYCLFPLPRPYAVVQFSKDETSLMTSSRQLHESNDGEDGSEHGKRKGY